MSVEIIYNCTFPLMCEYVTKSKTGCIEREAIVYTKKHSTKL